MIGAPRERRRRRRASRALLLVLAALLVFVLGVSLGRALEEGRRDGGVVTTVRTLKPLPLPPAPSTVTVTTG